MKNSTAAGSRCALLVLCGACALYLFFGLYMLDMPGLQYDEALFTNAAFGNVDGSYVAWELPLFGKQTPIMLMSYIGALKAYIYAPIFALFGANPIAFRLPVVLFGLITLLLTFLVVRRMLGLAAAIISTLLLAADPNFIYANKLDWGPVSLMFLLQMASLYCLYRWLTDDRLRFLVLGGFLLGLGLYNKVVFIWFLAALLLSLFLFYRKRLKEKITPSTAGSFIMALLLGCLPLIVYNLSTNMGSLAGRAGFARNWPDLLSREATIFKVTLDGSALYNVVNLADPAHDALYSKLSVHGFADELINTLASTHWDQNTLLPLYLAITGGLLLILFVWKKLDRRREIGFLLTMLFLMVFFILLTPEATGAHHAIAIFPIPHILIGAAIAALGGLAAAAFSKIPKGLIIAPCILPLLFSQVTTDARYLQSFQTIGGVRYWTDAIYNLAEFAKKHPQKTFFLMDWGLGNQLLLLSHAEIKEGQLFGDFLGKPEEERIARLQPILMRANAYFVFNAPPFEAFPILDTFERALQKYNLESVRTTFYQRNGQPAYYLYEIVLPK
jgi:4-amino-4-deoxy-L-arabinose transferase-like glycosyltransferase